MQMFQFISEGPTRGFLEITVAVNEMRSRHGINDCTLYNETQI